MTHPTRREALGVLTAAAAAGVLPLRPEELHAAWSHLAGLRQSGQAYRPRFFQPDEWATLQVLVDMILPADERSGSATEAGVPPFIDFVLAEGTDESARTQVREGLDVTTVILNNSSYAVLEMELARVGASAGGEKAHEMLDLTGPDLDFVSLARGLGVEQASRATTAEEFAKQLAAGLATEGPALIEAVVPPLL